MRIRHTILAILALAACDAGDSGSGTETSETSGSGTETTSGTETETEVETETGTGEASEPFWLVLDQASQIVGRLASPDARAVLDHTDVFGGIQDGGPRTLYLTLDSWGFSLVTAGPTFWPNAEPTGWVWYSDASCGADGGHPFDTYSPAKVASDCKVHSIASSTASSSSAFCERRSSIPVMTCHASGESRSRSVLAVRCAERIRDNAEPNLSLACRD